LGGVSVKKQHPIKDDEVRESENGLAIVLGVWHDGDQIRLVSKGGNFITTVNNKKGSKRCHENLYKHLKKLLQQYGKWKENKENEVHKQ
jgi:hypothetical protein